MRNAATSQVLARDATRSVHVAVTGDSVRRIAQMRAALSTLFQCSGYLETLAAGFSSTAKRFHFEPICDPTPLEPPSSPLALKRTPADWIKTARALFPRGGAGHHASAIFLHCFCLAKRPLIQKIARTGTKKLQKCGPSFVARFWPQNWDRPFIRN